MGVHVHTKSQLLTYVEYSSAPCKYTLQPGVMNSCGRTAHTKLAFRVRRHCGGGGIDSYCLVFYENYTNFLPIRPLFSGESCKNIFVKYFFLSICFLSRKHYVTFVVASFCLTVRILVDSRSRFCEWRNHRFSLELKSTVTNDVH